MLSGCSTNACLAGRKLGLQHVGLIGCVGADHMSKFTADMRTYGIEASVDTTSKETGGFHLIYDDKGNRTLDVLGVAGKIGAGMIPDKFLDADFFLIGPILGEVDLDLVKYLSSSTSAELFLDPQGLIRVVGAQKRIEHRCGEDFGKIAELVDFLKPNEPESQTITGETDPLIALRMLSKMGPRITMVTLAERGSLVSENGSLYRIPAFPVSAIDPTGAGDTYAGSFLVNYKETRNLAEAALFASAAASMKVEQVGPDFRMTRPEVENRVRKIRGGLEVE